MKKLILIELLITTSLYAVVMWHNLAPRAWAWLDETQLENVITAGTIWLLYLIYDSVKHLKDRKNVAQRMNETTKTQDTNNKSENANK